MFAFKKTRATTEDGDTEASSTSPKRSVLADCSPPNFEMKKKDDECQEDGTEDEDKKENYNALSKNSQNKVGDTSYRMQEKSKVIFELNIVLD